MSHLFLIIPFIALLIWWRIQYPDIKCKISEALVHRRLKELPSEYQVFRRLLTYKYPNTKYSSLQ